MSENINNNENKIYARNLKLEENSVFKNIKCLDLKFYSKDYNEEIKKINDQKINDGILKLGSKDGFFEFSYANFMCEFKIEDDVMRKKITNKLSNPRNKNLSNINSILKNEEEFFAFLNVYFFDTHINDILEIVVDDEDLKELQDFKTILSDGISKYFSFNIEDNIINIFSNDSYISCEVKDGYFKFKEKVKATETYKMFLSRGEVKITSSHGYRISKIANILNDKGNYFSKWEEYSKTEGEIILKRAKKIGFFQFKRSGEKLILNDDNKDVLENLNENDLLEFSDVKPGHLNSEIQTWEDYKKYREEEKKQKKDFNKTDKIKIKKIDFNFNTIYLDFEDINDINFNNMNGYLSIVGDITQIERRESAREKIIKAKSANPNIGLIISGKLNEIDIPKIENKKEISPISPLLNDKIFKNPPTLIQREAIKIALNTPDIAIIQGPPGTGKTTVITAIIERLNELSNKRNDNRGSVLVTSFQHDAVKNVIERLRINSLPTRKFGTQNEEDEFEDRIIEDWIDEIKNKVKENNKNLNDYENIENKREFDELYFKYIDFPTIKNKKEFLEYCLKIINSKEIRDEIDIKLEEIKLIESSNSNKFEKLLRNIRTKKISFEDDGDINNLRLKKYIEKSFSNRNNIKELNELFTLLDYNNVDEDYLKKLKEKRDNVLIKIKQNNYLRVVNIDEDIIEIYNNCLKNTYNSLDEVDKIFYDYYNNLSYNKYKLKNIISEYGYVYASTTQQSVGKSICEAKGLTTLKKEDDDKSVKYKTVIVDEAARVNPGDLMIPISQAEEKLILVGDHRQLPHIYDEEIMESLINKGSITEEEKERLNIEIKSTLFEILKGIAIELEKKDGIKRTITLDKQYRMHKILGDFVSDNFYKQYREGFESGLPDESFKQTLFSKPLVWKVLEHSKGQSQQVGVSRIRRCEANFIVEDIKNKIKTEEGMKYRFGVISFYSAQVKLIQSELEKNLDEESMKRVRVGSVDAFQGMEFDIIYLSVVRTEEKYRGRSPYGFLESENRLCVALSRQKRVLVVVGNPNIFIGKEFSEVSNKVEAIKNLYYLCKEKGEFI